MYEGIEELDIRRARWRWNLSIPTRSHSHNTLKHTYLFPFTLHTHTTLTHPSIHTHPNIHTTTHTHTHTQTYILAPIHTAHSPKHTYSQSYHTLTPTFTHPNIHTLQIDTHTHSLKGRHSHPLAHTHLSTYTHSNLTFENTGRIVETVVETVEVSRGNEAEAWVTFTEGIESWEIALLGPAKKTLIFVSALQSQGTWNPCHMDELEDLWHRCATSQEGTGTG